MAFVIYENIIRKIEQPKTNLMDINVDQLYEDHLNEQTKIELDSFVFDRHTGVATSRNDFAIQGAKVENECKELFIDKYREMYNEFKIMMDNEEEQKQTKKTKRKIQDSQENKTKKKMKVRENIFLYKLN
jgi:hypothetical protein